MDEERPPRREFDAAFGPNESTSDWCRRFYEQFVRVEGEDPVLFWKPDEERLYIAPSGEAPRPIFSEAQFDGEVVHVISVYKDRQAGSALIRTNYILNTHEVRFLFYSDYRRGLPVLNSIVLEPAVIFVDGATALTKRGWDCRTGVFYWKSPSSPTLTPKFTFEHLDKCFSGVPFERAEYKANVIASLLGAIILDKRFENPLLCITGNQPGIGKTKLCSSIGYILTGREPSPVSFESGEMMKQIGARFHEQQRFIMIDNVTTESGYSYTNDRLAVLLTQGHSKSVRELGYSRSVGASGVLFTLNANNCELDEDLAIRALPVKLYAEDRRPMVPYVYSYAVDHRFDLLQELYGLALQTDLPIQDSQIYPYFRFRFWLDFCFPRIFPHFGSLALDEAEVLDEAVLDFCYFAVAKLKIDRNTVFTLQEVLDFADGRSTFGLRNNGLKRRIVNCRDDNGKKKNLGVFIKTIVDKILSPTKDIRIKLVYVRKYRPVTFKFEVFQLPSSAEEDKEEIA